MNKEVILPVKISDDEFSLLREVIYKESGINLTDMKKALVQSRLMKRLKSLNIYKYRDYYNFLVENYNDEIVNLINCITTNKTDFFREAKHFDFMRSVALPEFEKAGKERIRIWSAGCSTGEEPYSIAITIYDYFNGKQMPDVKILATDIDTVVLQKGEEGIYNHDILKDVDPRTLMKYFLKGKGEGKGLFRIKDFVKKIVYFRRLNLLDETFPMKGRFDIIFCRNVIIYFDSESRVRLFEQFYNYLNEDGYLFAGHSETLTNISKNFYLIGNTTYKKIDKECI